MLVIIGLIVGGVLVGQDLIRAAEIRATITQVEKFNTAVNTFYGKYGALPGDMNYGVASTYGFALTNRGTTSQGDGNGLIEGGSANTLYQAGNETGMFWSDLSYANGMNLNLIEGGFQSASFGILPNVNQTQLSLYFPAAKLGRGNYFYVYTAGGYNYYGLGGMTTATPVSSGSLGVSPSMSVLQAYTIDKKVDDGLPASGRVQAVYVSGSLLGVSPYPIALTYAAANMAAVTTTSCYEMADSIYATGSTANGNGAAGLCALSFRFQ